MRRTRHSRPVLVRGGAAWLGVPAASHPIQIERGGAQDGARVDARRGLGRAAASMGSLLKFTSADGRLLANGKPFVIKGVTWWGAESARAVPGGLEKR